MGCLSQGPGGPHPLIAPALAADVPRGGGLGRRLLCYWSCGRSSSCWLGPWRARNRRTEEFSFPVRTPVQPREEAQGRGGAPAPPRPPSTGHSSPSPYLLEGGRPLEAAARSSRARPRAFFRDKAWLSQSSSSSSAAVPGWEGRLALAGESAPSGGGCAPEEEGDSPAGAERGPGAEGCLLGWGTEGVGSAEPLLRGSLVGEGGSRSSSSSLRPNQSAPPFLGGMGLLVAGGACLEPGSPLWSMSSSAKNLLQDREERV